MTPLRVTTTYSDSFDSSQMAFHIYKLEGNGPIDEHATVLEASVTNSNFIFEISNLD